MTQILEHEEICEMFGKYYDEYERWKKDEDVI